MKTSTYSLVGAAVLTTILASPTSTRPGQLSERQLLPSQITSESQLESIIAGLEKDGAISQENGQVLIELLEAIVPSPAPANPAAALSSIISVYAAHPTDFIASALSLPLGGLTWSDAVGLILGESPIENSSKSFNPINPSPAIYPMKGANDAPYSVSEATLRAAIYIPSDFTYRKVPPLLFIPGTGGTAGQNFAGNFAPLFKGSNYANAVFVNIPGNQLADIQVGRFPPLLFSSQKKTN